MGEGDGPPARASPSAVPGRCRWGSGQGLGDGVGEEEGGARSEGDVVGEAVKEGGLGTGAGCLGEALLGDGARDADGVAQGGGDTEEAGGALATALSDGEGGEVFQGDGDLAEGTDRLVQGQRFAVPRPGQGEVAELAGEGAEVAEDVGLDIAASGGAGEGEGLGEGVARARIVQEEPGLAEVAERARGLAGVPRVARQGQAGCVALGREDQVAAIE